jgi:hypothetical protein
MRAALTLPVVAALVAALAALSACSPPPRPSGATTAPPAAASRGTPCDRGLVTRDDAAAVLGAPPASMQPVEGLPTACRFESASHAGMTVRVASGGGEGIVSAAASPSMPVPFTPLPSVGGRAEWQASTHTLVAATRDELCEISVDGPPAATLAATPDKLGALCNRIFAVG